MEGNDIVKLNVGGMQYVTTRDTLMTYGDNFFSALLSEKFKVAKDGESIFIDRNGELFALVLDYLRTGELFIPKHLEREGIQNSFASTPLPLLPKSTTTPCATWLMNGNKKGIRKPSIH